MNSKEKLLATLKGKNGDLVFISTDSDYNHLGETLNIIDPITYKISFFDRI